MAHINPKRGYILVAMMDLPLIPDVDVSRLLGYRKEKKEKYYCFLFLPDKK